VVARSVTTQSPAPPGTFMCRGVPKVRLRTADALPRSK
jgi:hypothetical protein